MFRPYIGFAAEKEIVVTDEYSYSFVSTLSLSAATHASER